MYSDWYIELLHNLKTHQGMFYITVPIIYVVPVNSHEEENIKCLLLLCHSGQLVPYSMNQLHQQMSIQQQ